MNGDGTAVRDFVHVADMAAAFALALHACEPGIWRAYNVGSGHPSTVHDVIATTETVTARCVPRRHTAAAHEPATPVHAPPSDAAAAVTRRPTGHHPDRGDALTVLHTVVTEWRASCDRT